MTWIENLLTILELLWLPVTIIGGITSLFLWKQSGFWAPRYIHLLANLSALMALWLTWLAASVNHMYASRIAWLVMILPALIYFVFAFHGREIIEKHLDEKRATQDSEED